MKKTSQVFPSTNSPPTWCALSDAQKAKLLLGSFVNLDANEFYASFGSFEQPDVDIIQTAAINQLITQSKNEET